jgi:hypothetical protein
LEKPRLEMKVVTAHQPMYLPWLGLLEKISRADTFVSFDAVQMEDSGFENRNRIRTKDGWLWLTAPVRRSRDVLLCDLEIATEHDWQRKHFRTLEMHYSRAPRWAEYRPFFADLYLMRRWRYLAELNEHILTHLLAEFGWEGEMLRLSNLGVTGKGAELVLAMCEKVGATRYIFGACGRNYMGPAELARFSEAGVEVEFQAYAHPEYKQAWPGFQPFMMAYDLLLNHSREDARRIMLSGGSV